jgi:hypothetical protein
MHVVSANTLADEAVARRAARRIGLRARKSRWRRHSVDNRGGFMLSDPYRNAILAGERFDLADDLVRLCDEWGRA